MRDLWKTRLRRHQTQQFKYLQLVFNDHFVLIMVILFGGVLYGYSRLVRQLTATWWLGPVIAVVLTLLTMLGSLATLAEGADAAFLLPQTSAFSKYLFKARRYSMILPAVLLIFATIAVIPLMGVLGKADVAAILTLGIALLLFKDTDLWLQLLNAYEGTGRIGLTRALLFAIELLSIILGLWWYPASTMVIALVLDLVLRWRLGDWFNPARLDWLSLIQREDRRMSRIYRFYNMFTDVPGLSGGVRRRRYLDFLTKLVPATHQHAWGYLFIRGFLRRTEYSGLWLRLTLIGAVIVALVGQWWLAALLAIGIVYLIGFQLVPFYLVYDDVVFTHIYPFKASEKHAAFTRLVCALLLVVAIVLAIGALIGGQWRNSAVILVAAGVFSVIFAYWYLPLRLRKKTR